MQRYTDLHRHHMRRGKKVPDAPELAQLGGRAERDADMSVEMREGPCDQHAILAEVLHHLQRRVPGVEQDEVRVRVDRAKHPCVGLVAELLTAVVAAGS